MLYLLDEQADEFGGYKSQAGGILGTMRVFYHVTHGQPDLANELAEEIRHGREPRTAVTINLENALKGEIHH
jgi:hypothetical protein